MANLDEECKDCVKYTHEKGVEKLRNIVIKPINNIINCCDEREHKSRYAEDVNYYVLYCGSIICQYCLKKRKLMQTFRCPFNMPPFPHRHTSAELQEQYKLKKYLLCSRNELNNIREKLIMEWCPKFGLLMKNEEFVNDEEEEDLQVANWPIDVRDQH